MNINPPTKELLQALQGPDASALIVARGLSETLLMTAHALSKSPAALVQLCQQLSPDDSAVDAVKKVHDQLQSLLGSVTAFNDRWSAIRQEMLDQTRFLRQAVNERNDAIGYELRQLNAKLTGEKAQAQNKRKALTDAGVTADEAERLSPEPSDTAHAEQSAALHAERAIYSAFGRTLDAALLSPALHERAKELEHRKDWAVGHRQQVPA
ncbi:hypothetical protein [Limnohabitans sp. T6-5]|uniref:hypothetical protein n=1 Tax=Limnohabitans sp. T6-5 TaxID=1100724 RepID=UPI0011B21672|nr:hypothetical protein [Limnohabitans sp. T6-5]